MNPFNHISKEELTKQLSSSAAKTNTSATEEKGQKPEEEEVGNEEELEGTEDLRAQASEDASSELEVKVEEVEWLPGFYKVPAHIKIATLDAYKSSMSKIATNSEF